MCDAGHASDCLDSRKGGESLDRHLREGGMDGIGQRNKSEQDL